MREKILDLVIYAIIGKLSAGQAADKILSLIDENKNRLANEVQATKDGD